MIQNHQHTKYGYSKNDNIPGFIVTGDVERNSQNFRLISKENIRQVCKRKNVLKPWTRSYVTRTRKGRKFQKYANTGSKRSNKM